MDLSAKIEQSRAHLHEAIEAIRPHYIASMVSGGKDSACSHALAQELGVPVDIIIHGNTRTGIPQTTEFVKEHYGQSGPELVIADAGTAYEDYVLRKGFFGRGIAAHGFSYRVLKATPFRKVVSAQLRQRRRNIRVLLLNGARKNESDNRRLNLERVRADPAQKGNVWFNIIHDWSQDDRDAYLASRDVPINPVAQALCRSGECMCGTMQTPEQRVEAAAIYPDGGAWLDSLEAEARALHGFGWGEPFPRKRPNPNQYEMFQPMCIGCGKDAA